MRTLGAPHHIPVALFDIRMIRVTEVGAEVPRSYRLGPLRFKPIERGHSAS